MLPLGVESWFAGMSDAFVWRPLVRHHAALVESVVVVVEHVAVVVVDKRVIVIGSELSVVKIANHHVDVVGVVVVGWLISIHVDGSVHLRRHVTIAMRRRVERGGRMIMLMMSSFVI